MKTFKIEKNIPKPNPGRGIKKLHYPFEDMEIGDSFYVSKEDLKHTRLQHLAVRASASKYKSRHPGFKFTILTVDGGWRVWRV